MTTIVQQLDRALGDLGSCRCDTGQATDDLLYVLGYEGEDKVRRVVAAVAAMRLAMDDPSCVDEPEDDAPRPSSLLAGGSLHRDPTADAALVRNTARTQHTDLRRAIAQLAARADRAAHANTDTEEKRAVRQVTNKADYTASMVARWLPRYATAKERQESARELDPGCVSCARTFVAPGIRRWEPTYRGDLCSWCDRGPVGKRATGTVPPLDLLERHHAGSKVRVRA